MWTAGRDDVACRATAGMAGGGWTTCGHGGVANLPRRACACRARGRASCAGGGVAAGGGARKTPPRTRAAARDGADCRSTAGRYGGAGAIAGHGGSAKRGRRSDRGQRGRHPVWSIHCGVHTGAAGTVVVGGTCVNLPRRVSQPRHLRCTAPPGLHYRECGPNDRQLLLMLHG